MYYLKQPIIFLGVPRAGTTIISEIIFQHNTLAWVSNYQEKFPTKVDINRLRPILDNKLWQLRGQKDQLNKVPFYNKYAFKPSESYGFWNTLTSSHIDFSRDFLLGQKIHEKEKKEIRLFFEKMVKYQRRKRLAFKITGPSRIEFLSSIFPDACFIEITREPFSNIRSLLKVPFWEELGKKRLWWKGAYNESEMQQAEEWKNQSALLTAMQYKKIREITQQEIEQTGVSHYTIAFEEFIQNPAKEVNKLLDYVGLSRDQGVDSYMKKNEIYNRNIDSKAFFSPEEQVEINKIIGDSK